MQNTAQHVAQTPTCRHDAESDPSSPFCSFVTLVTPFNQNQLPALDTKHDAISTRK
jgi:hypothetical protein